ncbi:hypothetical protein ACGF5F_32540 [Streptomyces sp. NPDC047821]|uniref:hypothetical protein n=1 Tax=Streptomyces sp. NPDC047821 TaxID=3365488 RepID=UPI00371365A3
MPAYDPAVIQAMADAATAGVDATHIQNTGARLGLEAAHQVLQDMPEDRVENLRNHLPK